MKTVITISRQYGSGGREIGKKLADQLGIPFYDNEIISRAAKETGFSEAAFESVEDKATNSLLYSIAMGMNVFTSQDTGFAGLSLDDRIFLAQSNVIRKAPSSALSSKYVQSATVTVRFLYPAYFICAVYSLYPIRASVSSLPATSFFISSE